MGAPRAIRKRECAAPQVRRRKGCVRLAKTSPIRDERIANLEQRGLRKQRRHECSMIFKKTALFVFDTFNGDNPRESRTRIGQKRTFGARRRKLSFMTPLWDMPKQVTLPESA